jgi:hypothetical protein
MAAVAVQAAHRIDEVGALEASDVHQLPAPALPELNAYASAGAVRRTS